MRLNKEKNNIDQSQKNDFIYFSFLWSLLIDFTPARQQYSPQKIEDPLPGFMIK